MFERSHTVDSSATQDRKTLCNFGAELCKRRRLNGYSFCRLHILQDPSAPFKRCIFMEENKQCSNPVPASSEHCLCVHHEESPNSPQLQNQPALNGQPSETNLSIERRLKSKFGRLSDMSVPGRLPSSAEKNATPTKQEHTLDPYAFPDADPPKVMADVIPPQITTSPGGVLTLQFPILPSLHTPARTPTTPETSSPTIPIAKLYPELAEKLERVRKASGEVKTKPSGGKATSSKTTPNKHSSSQRTMNRLQTKIAQNKITDKLRKSLSTGASPDHQPLTPQSCGSSNSGGSPDVKSSVVTGSLADNKKTSTWGRKQSGSPKGQSGVGRSTPPASSVAIGNPNPSDSLVYSGVAMGTSSSSLSQVLHNPQQTYRLPSPPIKPNTLPLPTSTSQITPIITSTSSPLIIPQSPPLITSKIGIFTSVSSTTNQSQLSDPEPSVSSPTNKHSSKPHKHKQKDDSTSPADGLTSRKKTCRVRPQLARGVMSENEARVRLKRHSAVKAYSFHAKHVKDNTDLIPMGIDSSEDSDVDDRLPWQKQWLLSSTDDDEIDEDVDECLASNIRCTKILLYKSKLRRQFSQLQTMLQGNAAQRSEETNELSAVVNAARASLSSCVSSLMATRSSGSATIPRPSVPRPPVSGPIVSGRCGVSLDRPCLSSVLPHTNYCQDHILQSTDQQLFDFCTAKFADHTPCCRPVFDCRHELPLCPEHAAKADNYGKNLEPKPKKPRKKTKPSALTRPPKKGKKKKNQRRRPQKPVTPPSSDPAFYSASSAGCSSELHDDAPDSSPSPAYSTLAPPTRSPRQQHNAMLGQSAALSQDDHLLDQSGVLTEEDPLVDSDFGDDLEQSFSPGTIEKNLGLPLDTDQVTKFLDEHDLNDVLNKLPDEAFDLLAGTPDKNGLVYSREDNEVFAQAFAEVSHNFTKDSIDKLSQDTGVSMTSDTMGTLASFNSDPVTSRVAFTSDSVNSRTVFSNPVNSRAAFSSHPVDSRSTFAPHPNQTAIDDSRKSESPVADELTNRIAHSLLHDDPLSPSGSISDDLGQDNINDLASSFSAHDLKSISQVLSSCTSLNSALPGSRSQITSAQTEPQGQFITYQTVVNSQGHNAMTSTGQNVMTSQRGVPGVSFPVFQTGVDSQTALSSLVQQQQILDSRSQQVQGHRPGQGQGNMTVNLGLPQNSLVTSALAPSTVSPASFQAVGTYPLVHTDTQGLVRQAMTLQTNLNSQDLSKSAPASSLSNLMLDGKSGSGFAASVLTSARLPTVGGDTSVLSVSNSALKLAYPLQTLIPAPMLTSTLQPTLTLAGSGLGTTQNTLLSVTTRANSQTTPSTNTFT